MDGVTREVGSDARALAELRQRRRLSPEQVARRMGVHPSQYRALEGAHVQDPALTRRAIDAMDASERDMEEVRTALERRGRIREPLERWDPERLEAIQSLYRSLSRHAGLETDVVIARVYRRALALFPEASATDVWIDLLRPLFFSEHAGSLPYRDWIDASCRAFVRVLLRQHREPLGEIGVALVDMEDQGARRRWLERLGDGMRADGANPDLLVLRGQGTDAREVLGCGFARVSASECGPAEKETARQVVQGGLSCVLYTLDAPLSDRGTGLGTREEPSRLRRFIEAGASRVVGVSFNPNTEPTSPSGAGSILLDDLRRPAVPYRYQARWT